jgi:uncharacterized membrane protein YhaH (DUF805 family)
LLLLLGTIVGHTIASTTLTIRRLHDIGRSGWWMLISLIPLLGGLIVLAFLCIKGQAAENHYGPPVA